MRPSILLLITATVFAGAPLAACAQQSGTAHLQAIGGSINTPNLAVDGAITEVVSKRSSGSPQGTHLLVRSSMQTVDVSVGPYLSSDMKKKMSEGARIQITGFMESTSGKNYLMAREVVLDGQKYTIRNQNGFLNHNPAPDGQPATGRHHEQRAGGVN